MYRGVAGRMHLMELESNAPSMVVKNLRQAYKGPPTSLDPEQLADRSACWTKCYSNNTCSLLMPQVALTFGPRQCPNSALRSTNLTLGHV